MSQLNTTETNQPAASRRWLWWLGAYFAMMALGRILASDSAELDESEQLMLTQNWSWSYGSQLPCYTWLQAVVFVVTGPSVPGLALLKAGLLFMEFNLAYVFVRRSTGKELPARVALLAMFLIPQLIWESQRDLTHTVLASTIAVATLALWQRLVSERKTIHYLLLGVCVAVGTLSKLNYPLFFIAFTLAALTQPQGRRALLNWRGLLSLAVALLLMSMPAVAILTQPQAILSESQKFVTAATSTWLAWGKGLSSLGWAVGIFVGPLVVVYLILFRRAAVTVEESPDTVAMRVLIGRTLLIGIGLAVIMVFVVRAHYKERWLQPLLILTPIYLGLLADGRLRDAQARWFTGLGITAALLVMLVLPAIPFLAILTQRPTRLNAPFVALSAELKKRGHKPEVIMGESRLTGGNLRMSFPHSRVVTPEWPLQSAPTNTSWLIAWDASRSAEPPPRLKELATKRLGFNLEALTPFYIQAPLKYMRTNFMKLGCVEIPVRTAAEGPPPPTESGP